MRKIVVGLFISLDGVIEGPGPQDNFARAGWTMPYYTPEIGQIIGQSMMTSDALLLGRVTYQGFESSFASQTDEMAMALNNQRKYVVSTTLERATWNNSTLIRGNVPEEIAKLKQQDGKDINTSGSGTLVKTLMQHNLVDEYGLFLYPVVVGQGQRLFDEGLPNSTFKLVEARPLSTGVVYLRYQPVKSE